jgi:hypothetical protein
VQGDENSCGMAQQLTISTTLFLKLGLNLFSVNALNDPLLIVSHVFKYGVCVMRGTLVKIN